MTLSPPPLPGLGSPSSGAGPADGLPPAARLLVLTHGKRISQVLYAVAELRIADQLVDGPRSTEQLAAATQTLSEPLYRLLRCAATFGLLDETTEGVFAQTPLSAALRSDVPGSQRDMVLLNGDEVVWRPYGEILHTLRTGQPAFEHLYGTDFFSYLAEHPGTGAVFDGAMASMSELTIRQLVPQLDLSPFRVVADIGGGRGRFLAELLARHPGLNGILVDRPEVVAEAEPTFARAGVADRVQVRAGDFFVADDLPVADAYLLKAVLHDWDDDQASQILRAIRSAMGDRPAVLFLGEQVVSGANVFDPAKLIDLDMMLRFGGRERTLSQWRRLAAAAGFTLELPDDAPPSGWRVLRLDPR